MMGAWEMMDGTERFFWIIAVGASLLQILLSISSFAGGHEADHGTDHGSANEGMKLLSVRAIIAFMVGFGWTGALMMANGGKLIVVAPTAILVGFGFTAAIYGLMRYLISLKADGTLDYRNAVGQSGQVYVTIPPRRTAPGQVEVLFQGRLVTASALTDSETPLAPNTRVVVRGVEGGTTLLVEAAG